MTTATLNTNVNSWTLRLFTLLIWLLLGLCTAYWAFKFVTTQTVEATVAQPTSLVAVDSKAIAKLLGATDGDSKRSIGTVANSKFALFGLAATNNSQGFALIAVDGKPAKPYRVGNVVADNLVLKSINKTNVVLAASLQSPDDVTLTLPERKPASLVVQSLTPPRVPPPGIVGSNPVAATAGPLLPNQQPAVQPAETTNKNSANPANPANAASGAAAAANAVISRFAPQQSAQTSDAAAPNKALPTANSSAIAER